MSTDNFEWAVRQRMQMRGAELDRAIRPAPPLAVLLAPTRTAGVVGSRTNIRFGGAAVGTAAVVLGLIAGSFLFAPGPGGGPLSSVTPSSVSSPATQLPWSGSASPSLSPAVPSTTAKGSSSPQASTSADDPAVSCRKTCES